MWILNEYLTILKIKLFKTYKAQASLWKLGTAGEAVLIPGWGGDIEALLTIGNKLNELGYKIHTISDLGGNYSSLKQSTNIVTEYISNNCLSNAILVGHSKGGLIAANTQLKIPKKVRRVIAIACPWDGSLLGHLHILGLQDLKPNSVTLKNLRSTLDRKNIFNLYPTVDNHVIPNKSLILDGANNIQIKVKGHTLILFSKETEQQLCSII